jgi:hypothetical protein
MPKSKLEELAELNELLTITSLSTPDGRWQALQDFLTENPAWKKRESDFLKARPEDAPTIICAWLNLNPTMITVLDRDGTMRRLAVNAFRELQQLYREKKDNA